MDVKLGFDIITKRLGLDMSIKTECAGDGFEVSKGEGSINIRYGTKRDLFRALTFVKEVCDTGKTVSQKAGFNMLCYMVDISRNAVLNMDGVKNLIVDLAMMGYDSMMLYTEDTYEIPEYPYFGHMRGRYTQAQMKEIDEFGNAMGIEVIPCMQTLAHLATMLRWKVFGPITDTKDILLADCDETYDLIDCMLKSLSECFSTKRIHLGMDEAHDLGLGKYLDLHGYQDRFSILSKHLDRVCKICDKYGLKPMIWSDMYFRLYNHGSYYMKEGELPDSITELVPENVEMVYWDYYSTDEQILDCMFKNHAKFKGNTIFAGGAWKWSGFAPYGRISNECANIHINACVRHGCRDIIVTGWGDNGAEASQFSILPTLSLYAERCFENDITDSRFAERFNDCFDISLDAFLKLDLANEVYDELIDVHATPCKFMLYNAPLGGLCDYHIPAGVGEKFAKNREMIESAAEGTRFSYIFDTLAALCNVLELKAEMSNNIRTAYLNDDRKTLEKYANEIMPETVDRIQLFLEVFRRQWYAENKTLGFDTQEIRLGGLMESIISAALRINNYLSGNVAEIEELTYPVLPIAFGKKSKETGGEPAKMLRHYRWTENATASIL